jgi:hypothetical protein
VKAKLGSLALTAELATSEMDVDDGRIVTWAVSEVAVSTIELEPTSEAVDEAVGLKAA